MQKIASINFYNDENLLERQLKLKIDNILFFREALVKRMTNLKVKTEAKKLIKGQQQERRLTAREINTMNINQIVQSVNQLKQKIDNNEVNYYNVNTLTTLCGKAIEHYSAVNDESHVIYLNIMKAVLQRDDVQKITSEDK
jgi:RecA/RadA recombinase